MKRAGLQQPVRIHKHTIVFHNKYLTLSNKIKTLIDFILFVVLCFVFCVYDFFMGGLVYDFFMGGLVYDFFMGVLVYYVMFASCLHHVF